MKKYIKTVFLSCHKARGLGSNEPSAIGLKTKQIHIELVDKAKNDISNWRNRTFRNKPHQGALAKGIYC